MKTDSHSFDEMLDYGICNLTYRLDKTDHYELDYEVMIVTTQIFVLVNNEQVYHTKD